MNRQDAFSSWAHNFQQEQQQYARMPYYTSPSHGPSSQPQYQSHHHPHSGVQKPAVGTPQNLYGRGEPVPSPGMSHRHHEQQSGRQIYADQQQQQQPEKVYWPRREKNRGEDRRSPKQPTHGGGQQHKTDANEVLRRLFLQKNIDISSAVKLGAGKYSKVVTARLFKGDNCQDYKTVAIKVINREKVTREFRDKFLPREIDCWRKLNHPHLVKILGHYEAMKYVFLTMEHGEVGDLLRYVQKNGPLPEEHAREWLTQICHGVGYMHAKGVAHRDLKLENIICFGDGTVKVADFGFARQLHHDTLSHTYCGSKSYSAPEILCGRPYSPLKSDVWSVGVIGFVMVTDTMPFRESHTNARIVDAQKQRRYNYPSRLYLSSACTRSLDAMMMYDPARRPNIAQCIRLPFFTNDGIWSQLG